MPWITVNGKRFETEQCFYLPSIRNLPQEYYPLPIVCYDIGAFFTFAVAKRTDGDYSHFMWLIGPDEFATQGWWFQSKPVDAYSSYIIKAWYNPWWTPAQRAAVIKSLRDDLAKSPWETRYDVLALVGHLLGIKWIQSGRFEICSDSIDHIKHAGDQYDLKDQNPSQINAYFKLFPERWFVLFRYQGGD
jgi:hypothetical protein